MTAVDISLFNSGSLEQASHHTPSYSHYRVQHRHSNSIPSIQPSNPLMALDPRASHYPLFIEPHLSDSPTREEYLEQSKPVDVQTSTESNPTRGIIDKIKTIKLDTPALRRAQMAFQHPPRSSSLARGGQPEQTPTAFLAYGQTGEPSAFAITTARLQAAQTARNSRIEQDGTPAYTSERRNDNHIRNQSLQQRRTAGALTIASPTARQARGRPAGPMIWLPDEQVWLLAESDAGANASTTAGTGVAFPNSAPLHETPRGHARGDSRSRSRAREQDASERNRLHRSDSSPIRTQFLRLILNRGSDTSFTAQDWTATRASSGPSAAEEDAIWYEEQQARARGRRDQDRFSPMLQQALGGVDLQFDPSVGDHSGEYLRVPGEDGELWAAAAVTAHTMRRSSTTGDIDNIANVLASTDFTDFGYAQQGTQGQRRTIAQRRSGSLRSRVSTVGNEDYMYAPEAALHIRELKETGPKRRHSADEADTPRTASEADDYGHEWLASLVAQGLVPEGIFTPRGSVSDGLHVDGADGAATPRGGSRSRALGRLSTRDMQSMNFNGDSTASPARTGTSGISPIVSAGGLSRAATTAGRGVSANMNMNMNMSGRATSRDRWMSVSTAANDDGPERDGGDVSPVSSRGRDSLYD